MTPKQALIRGGHKHPEQILADLEAGGCIVLNSNEAEEYETVMEQIDDSEILGLTLEEYINQRAIWAYNAGYDTGYKKGLDVGKNRFG